ncbi:hypothetical protein N658DRAFT_562849 [Parathielavia hyrcaniae]|uniref:Uncharacterized protein n=1 Tax=Parathielavia hyrcaniae TaxID=113614 RepID=A0AAN6PQC8_9PEZI|nr:hypothetical protein N658DRAFT_562849 [Parathielavia hyrcaniae]
MLLKSARQSSRYLWADGLQTATSQHTAPFNDTGLKMATYSWSWECSARFLKSESYLAYSTARLSSDCKSPPSLLDNQPSILDARVPKFAKSCIAQKLEGVMPPMVVRRVGECTVPKVGNRHRPNKRASSGSFLPAFIRLATSLQRLFLMFDDNIATPRPGQKALMKAFSGFAKASKCHVLQLLGLHRATLLCADRLRLRARVHSNSRSNPAREGN